MFVTGIDFVCGCNYVRKSLSIQMFVEECISACVVESLHTSGAFGFNICKSKHLYSSDTVCMFSCVPLKQFCLCIFDCCFYKLTH